MPDHYGLKVNGTLQQPGAGGGNSPLEKQMAVGSHMTKRFDLQDPYVIQQDQKFNNHSSLDKHLERASVNTLWRPHDSHHDSRAFNNLNAEPASSYYMKGDKSNVMGAHYENGLFSSSLSDLYSRKLRLSSNNGLYGHSVGAAAAPPTLQYDEEVEPFESLEDIEAQTIGNLLPNDDDLFSGVTVGLDYITEQQQQPSSGDDDADLDFFSSVGGMDMGEDSIGVYSSNGQLPTSSFQGEHPHGEHPSRTLFVRNINSSVEDSELRSVFEQYGDIRSLYTACKHRGFVIISYFDIRAARNAMKALQNKPLKSRKLDIHFSIPKDNPSEKDINQGTLEVFNLDPSVSSDELHQIFGVYGEIKEIRETPQRRNQKFIEFYDVRSADAALQALNKGDIGGKRVNLESILPGGARRLTQFPELEQDDSSSYLQQSSPSNGLGFSGAVSLGQITSSSGVDSGGIMTGSKLAPITPVMGNVFRHELSSSVPTSLSSLMRMESASMSSTVAAVESCRSTAPHKFDIRGATPSYHPHSLPEYYDDLTNNNAILSNSPGTMMTNFIPRSSERNDIRPYTSRVNTNAHSLDLNDGVFGPSGNGSSIAAAAAHNYIWGNSHLTQPPPPHHQGMVWPNSPSFVNGGVGQQQLHSLARAPSHMLNTILPPTMNHHHVGSAPSVNPPSIWDMRHSTYTGESPDAASSVFHPGSLGNMRNSPLQHHHHHPFEYVSPNVFPRVVGMDLPVTGKNVGLHSSSHVIFPGRGGMVPTSMLSSSFDSSSNERTRSSRRNDGGSNHQQSDNKKQFELDIDRISRGEDKRTTLMIKNIPNKYTSKMLLAAIDERHRGTYDFIYLPIDFKNKCNVGYAFINMTDPSLIVPFYQAFNGKKWEKFNSEKVASLAYARIQGKTALIAHFQNSSLMNEDKRCRPILFHTDGPNAGDQVPFPMGGNVRTRPNKNRGSTCNEEHSESSFDMANGEESLYAADSFAGGSAKDSAD